ncbi:hypothetical protein C8E89_108106 [Mycolicibacterium moriokaense]|uniref:Uncharacterized protein n=1 Tax=Mycolicibacterium moriokaense TaxID=39691 RepID=A0A318HG57_9MYCO|nr:hypothetical protein C8E89_108106 [Mycolicibacterium moriokaense]
MADCDITMIDDVFANRYGEVLLVRVATSGPEATVYNTFPLNDCPAEQWAGSMRTRSLRKTALQRHYSTALATG